MIILKKVIRKLYHLIFLLSAFLLFVNKVDAVTINPKPTTYYAYKQFEYVTSPVSVFAPNKSFYSPSTSFPQGPGTPSSPDDPRSFSWFVPSSSCYSSEDKKNHGGKIVLTIGLNMAGTFVDDLSTVSLTAEGTTYACTWSKHDGNGSLADVTCYAESFKDFTLNYSYVTSRQSIIGSQPLFYNVANVECDFDDLIVSQSVKESTTKIIQNNTENTFRIGKWITDLGSSIGHWFGQLGDKIGGFFDNLLNFFKDDSTDSPDNNLNDLNDKVASNSVISDLLLLPVKFLQNFVNALGSSCTQFSLGNLYGTDLFMPCINIGGYLGTGIWTTIDLIFSGFFVYYLRKKFVEIYYNITNLKNGGNEVD